MQINGGTQILQGSITADRLAGSVVTASKITTCERHVGDGSTTEFALGSGGPVLAQTPRPLEVYLNGILQDPGEDNNGDYSYDSEDNAITFAVAPSNGAIILMNYLWDYAE